MSLASNKGQPWSNGRGDPDKDRLNRLSHQGLSLAAGVSVLADPLATSRPDSYPYEARWQTVGSAGGIAVLFVVHTERPGSRTAGWSAASSV